MAWQQAIFQVSGQEYDGGTAKNASGYMHLDGQVMFKQTNSAKEKKQQSTIMLCSLKEKNLTYESMGKHPHCGVISLHDIQDLKPDESGLSFSLIATGNVSYSFRFRDHEKCEEWKRSIANNIERMRHGGEDAKQVVHRGSLTSRFGFDPKLGGSCVVAFNAIWLKDSHDQKTAATAQEGFIGIFPDGVLFRSSLSSSLQSLNSEEIKLSDIALIEGPKKGRYGDADTAQVVLHLLKGWTRLWTLEFKCGLWADCFTSSMQRLLATRIDSRMEDEAGYAGIVARASLRASQSFHHSLAGAGRAKGEEAGEGLLSSSPEQARFVMPYACPCCC